MIFVHWIKWLTFTEKVRPIGEGLKFAFAVLTRTAEFPQQRRSLPSLLTGFGVSVTVHVPAALSP